MVLQELVQAVSTGMDRSQSSKARVSVQRTVSGQLEIRAIYDPAVFGGYNSALQMKRIEHVQPKRIAAGELTAEPVAAQQGEGVLRSITVHGVINHIEFSTKLELERLLVTQAFAEGVRAAKEHQTRAGRMQWRRRADGAPPQGVGGVNDIVAGITVSFLSQSTKL